MTTLCASFLSHFRQAVVRCYAHTSVDFEELLLLTATFFLNVKLTLGVREAQYFFEVTFSNLLTRAIYSVRRQKVNLYEDEDNNQFLLYPTDINQLQSTFYECRLEYLYTKVSVDFVFLLTYDAPVLLTRLKFVV